MITGNQPNAVHLLWCPTQVVMGNGSLDNLAAICVEESCTRAFLVSGRSAAATNLIDRIQMLLKRSHVESETFARVVSEPASDAVDAALGTFLDSRADCVVGIGGGSAMDVAKFVGMLAANGGKCVDYEAGRPVRQPGPPVIAVPTTAGSGSEVTPYSVITNASTRRKFTVTHPFLHPRHALIDSSLTTSLGAEATLAPGLDAWVQALEAYLSRLANPLIDPWAERAMHLVYDHLAKTLRVPSDLDARTGMSQAALLGGLAISHVRTGMIHTISVALAPHAPLPHGLLNAVVTPWVLEFNLDAYNGRLATAVARMGGKVASDREALDYVRNWLQSLGVPDNLPGHTPGRDWIPGAIARINQDKGLPEVNVRAFCDDDLAALLDRIVYAGTT